MIGIFSSLAFAFFPEVEAMLLFTRNAVFADTEPATLPPLASTEALNSALFLYSYTEPVITKVSPSRLLSEDSVLGSGKFSSFISDTKSSYFSR